MHVGHNSSGHELFYCDLLDSWCRNTAKHPLTRPTKYASSYFCSSVFRNVSTCSVLQENSVSARGCPRPRFVRRCSSRHSCRGGSGGEWISHARRRSTWLRGFSAGMAREAGSRIACPGVRAIRPGLLRLCFMKSMGNVHGMLVVHMGDLFRRLFLSKTNQGLVHHVEFVYTEGGA